MLTQARRDRRPDIEAEALSRLGRTAFALSHYEQALERYEAALAIRRARADRRGEAAELNGVALAHAFLGRYAAAQSALDAALVLARGAFDRDLEGTALSNMGLVSESLGEARKAIDAYQRALSVIRTVGDTAKEAITLTSLGRAWMDAGDASRALESHRRALALARTAGDRRAEAAALVGLGSSSLATRRPVPAREACAAAVEAARASGSIHAEGWALLCLARVEAAAGHFKDSARRSQQAALTFHAVADPHAEGQALSALMDALRGMNMRPSAIFWGKQAVIALQRVRHDLHSMAWQSRRAFVESNARTYRVLADLLIAEGRLTEAEQVLGLVKEAEYREFAVRDAEEEPRGIATLTPEEAAWDSRYRDVSGRMAALGAERAALAGRAAPTGDEAERLARIDRDIAAAGVAYQAFMDELEATVGRTREGADRLYRLREAEGLMETLRELGPGVVALYTLVTEDRLSVVLVTPDVQKAAQTPITEDQLARTVVAAREALRDPGRDARPALRELYRVVIEPVVGEIEAAGAKTLVLSLDGPLRYVPVAALHDGTRYLAERWGSVVLTPASYARLKDRPQPAWRALALGVSQPHAGFAGLPGVVDELRVVVRDGPDDRRGLFPGAVRLDGAFTAQAMREALRERFSLVHIASHFVFQPGDDTMSFLLLGDGAHFTLRDVRTTPNLFSGVEMLTLSACQTGIGGSSASGREIDGLGETAQRKGAKAVLATLWSVADESTALLMRELYQNRSGGVSKAEALRMAQLALLRGTVGSASGPSRGGVSMPDEPSTPRFEADPRTPYAHPFFWAPFVLIGNWQ